MFNLYAAPDDRVGGRSCAAARLPPEAYPGHYGRRDWLEKSPGRSAAPDSGGHRGRGRAQAAARELLELLAKEDRAASGLDEPTREHFERKSPTSPPGNATASSALGGKARRGDTLGLGVGSEGVPSLRGRALRAGDGRDRPRASGPKGSAADPGDCVRQLFRTPSRRDPASAPRLPRGGEGGGRRGSMAGLAPVLRPDSDFRIRPPGRGAGPPGPFRTTRGRPAQ
jgi:hypothetical protein